MQYTMYKDEATTTATVYSTLSRPLDVDYDHIQPHSFHAWPDYKRLILERQ